MTADPSSSEIEDLVPDLPHLSDMFSEISDESDTNEVGSETQIGSKHEATISRFGTVPISTNKQRQIWDCRKLSSQEVESYLELANKHWKSSYLHKLVDFSEQHALKILHIKRYNVNKALEAIVHERLPYVACNMYVVIDREKPRKNEDLRALRNGEDLIYD